jgi:CxC2 like cysteine cluster associated with KDZ transposases
VLQRTQILRARWVPATLQRPKTVFTFDALETFHELTLQDNTIRLLSHYLETDGQCSTEQADCMYLIKFNMFLD